MSRRALGRLAALARFLQPKSQFLGGEVDLLTAKEFVTPRRFFLEEAVAA